LKACKAVAAICNEYQISPSLYYQWREQFLAHASNAFEAHQHTQTEARLAQENARLKRLVGELTLERNKSDALLG
jgi:transposase-like protein